ncbi:hypothetical protein PG994_004984 [Apiospora phragmitis]|uniref:DUF7708 domain-containing protein n=1 Tax=Apiospora phragmitis TaxID=2905665 RepID=A0ABR1VS62_9PEZI
MGSLDHRDLDLIQKSDNEQREFHQFVEGSRGFTDEERAALKICSFSALEVFWGDTVAAKRAYDIDHSHGRKKLARRSQDFAATAFEVFREMAPMFDLISNIAAPFGGLAIGTLSFFLTLANTRKDMEGHVGATMIAIRDNVPRLQLYQQIYNDRHQLDQRLQTKIVQAYDIIMRFCMEATDFFRRSGMRRFLRTMKRSDQLVGLSSEFKDALVGVRHLAEVLLSKKVDLIKKQISGSRMLYHTIRAARSVLTWPQNAELQESLNGDRLSLIQRLFRLETYSEEAHRQALERYHSDLATDTDLTMQVLEQMRDTRLTALLNHQHFQAWQSTESKMLLLVGYNHLSILYSNQCWVSPVAMHFAHKLRNPVSSDLNAVYVAGKQRGESLSRILFTVLLQLLKQRPSALQSEDGYAELQAKLHEYEEMDEASDTLVSVLRSIALRVIDSFEASETVWIILDRVQTCGYEGNKAGVRRNFLRLMVYLVERSRARLRVLAIVNGHDWYVDREVDGLEIRKSGSVIVHTIRQQELEIW